MECSKKGVESMIYGWWPKITTVTPPTYDTFEGVESMKKYMKKHPMKSMSKDNFVTFIIQNPKAKDMFEYCDADKDGKLEAHEVVKCATGYI